MIITRFFLLLLSFAVAGCSKDEGNPSDTTFNIKGTMTHDGESRTYFVHLPPGYYEKDDRLPLVFAFHGGGGSAQNFRSQSGLDEKSDLENFIIVYPDGLQNPGALKTRTWNAGKCCGPNALNLNTDDVGFVSALIDELRQTYRVDEKRIYATGHSNGAMLCYRLANELSLKIAAIAPNAGNFQMRNEYRPARNVPVIHIASVLDENVHYQGGVSTGPAGQYNPPVDSCLNVVAALANCTSARHLRESHELYSVYEWSGCHPDTFEELLYLTNDGGHSWPGGNKGSQGGDNASRAFNNNDVIWEFFKKHSLP